MARDDTNQIRPGPLGMNGITGFGVGFQRTEGRVDPIFEQDHQGGPGLLQNITRLINREAGKPARPPVQTEIAISSGQAGRRLQTSLNELLSQLDPAQDLFLDKQALEATPLVLEGGEVHQSEPVSMTIVLEPMVGLYQGKTFTTERPIDILITDDGVTLIWFLTVDEGGMVRVLPSYSEEDFPVAKVIIPEPGTTARILDKPLYSQGYDGYIIHRNDPTFFNDFKVSDRNITDLRNQLVEIPGELVTGRITLSENVKIGNALGTVFLDSQEIQFFDNNNNRLARLGRNGLLFYDANGVQVTRYTSQDARIGNLVLDGAGIHSADYVARQQGLFVGADGTVDVENARIRGNIYLRRQETGSLFGYVNRLHNVSNITIQDGIAVQFSDLADDQTGILLEAFDKRPVVLLSRYGAAIIEPTFFTPVIQDANTWSTVTLTTTGVSRGGIHDAPLEVSSNDGAAIEDEDAYWITYDPFRWQDPAYPPQVDQDPDVLAHRVGKSGDITTFGHFWVKPRVRFTAPTVLDRFGDPVVVRVRFRFWRGFVDEVLNTIHTPWSYQSYVADFKYLCNGKQYRFSHLFTTIIMGMWSDGKVDLVSTVNETKPLNDEDTSPLSPVLEDVTITTLTDYASRGDQLVSARILSQNLYY